MKRFKINKNIHFIPLLAFFFCIYFIFAPERYKPYLILMNFIYAISISIIAAYIFYIFNIILPEKKRKTIIKQNFEEQYLFFKEECIYIFLSALGQSSNKEIWEKLCDLEEFKNYFKENFINSQDRWHKVWQELDGRLLEDLLIQLSILRDEVAFILNNTEINEKSVLSFFRLLSQRVYNFKARGINMEYEDKKSLLRFLWELFTGWSFADGYRKEDIVKLMTKEI
jgi:hypothetical protein